MPENIILTIDISNSKIVSIIAKNESPIKISILGVGISKANGIEKGKIINMDLAAESIKTSIELAKEGLNVDISKVYVSISASHVVSMTENAMVNVPSGEISVREINLVLKTAINKAAIPPEMEVIHALPVNFSVENNSHIQDPQNFISNKLESTVNIFIVPKSYLNNIKQAIRNCGVEVNNFVLNGYASSLALFDDELNNEKKINGYLVIDIGSSSTNASIYKGRTLLYTKFYPIGGDNISKDISVMLNTSITDAHTIKLQNANLLYDRDDASATIKIPKNSGDNEFVEVSAEYFRTIVHCRLEELLYLIKDDIESNHLINSFKSGIVLTGGTSKIKGIRDLCFKIFDSESLVKLDYADNIKNEFHNFAEPMYTTTVGLIRYALNTNPYYEIDSAKHIRAKIEKQPTQPEPKQEQTKTDLENVSLHLRNKVNIFDYIKAFFAKHF